MADTSHLREYKRKLTPEMAAEIVALVRQGIGPSEAAARVGVDRTAITRWVKRGESERAEPELADFALRYREAEARWEADQLARIDAIGLGTLAPAEGAKTDWKAIAWRLEKRFPLRYGSTSRVMRDRVRAEIELTNARIRALQELPADVVVLSSPERAIDELMQRKFGSTPTRYNVLPAGESQDADEAVRAVPGREADD